MRRHSVFYSFHYKNDVNRVQLIRNIGALDGNEPVLKNEWEKIKQKGEQAVKNWIDTNLKYKNVLVVLIGSETYDRYFVRYEIKKAWEMGKPMLGIYIHNINCMNNGTCKKGRNPFEYFNYNQDTNLSQIVKCYNPNPNNAYKDISDHISSWIEEAKIIKAKYN